MMLKNVKTIILIFLAAIIIYGGMALYVYHMSTRSGVQTYQATGTITAITGLGDGRWGLLADWSIANPLASRKLRFAELPDDIQSNGQRILIKYQIQDVIGGNWGTVIHVVSYQKI